MTPARFLLTAACCCLLAGLAAGGEPDKAEKEPKDPPAKGESIEIKEKQPTAKAQPPAEEPAAPEEEKKPEEKPSVEFLKTPASEIIDYVARRAEVSIVVDPACQELLKTPVTLRARGMKLRQLLDWTLRLSGTKRQFTDGAIYITPDAGGEKTNLREEVRKLLLENKDGALHEPPDFPAPEVGLPFGK